MKKLFFLFFAVLYTTLVFGQTKVGEYSLSYTTKLGKASFDIEATEPKKGAFDFYIYAWSAESEEEVGFSIDSKQLPDFFSSLRAVGDKLEEWTKTAKENGVTDYDKDFGIKFGTYTAFFKYGRNYHFSRLKFSPYFKVTSEGECLAVFRSYELTASDNRFMKHEGFMIPFLSKEEIEDFIEALDPNPILNKEASNAATDDLFK